ncbi:MAG TPA: amino acid adenylation domain-containing protein [Pseudonocardiaceae bacterium]|nr:amino acid adenylation domain-containing protein [Pseudonocardiaceae bacterium]
MTMDSSAPAPRMERASFGQEQLWLAEQVVPGTSGFHTVRMWELHGSLDLAALRASADLVVARHEALRTTLHIDESGLWQRVRPPRPVELEEFDIASATEPDLDDVRQRLKRPFDLASDQVFRALLGRIAPDHHLFVMNVHHSACDSWSFNLIRAELTAAYAAYAAGAEPDLPGPGTRYTDFVRRERDWWNAGGRRMSRKWLASLAEVPSLYAPLPEMGRRELVGPVRTLCRDVRADNLSGLLARATAAGATANMAMSGLFALLLSRWTGRDRVVFSSPVGTRSEPDVERTVGFFVNSLPMIVDVAGCRDFEELLGRVRPVVLNTIMHASVPPAQVRAALSGGASSARFDPMHAITLSVEQWAPTDFALGDVAATDRFIHPGDTTFGMSVRVDVGEQGARVWVEYDSDAVSGVMAARFAEHFDELIEAVARDGRIADLPAVPRQDEKSLADLESGEWTDGTADLLTAVAAHTVRQPTAVAVRDGSRSLTFGALWAAAGAVAGELRGRGTGREDVVAIRMPRSVRLLVAVLGVLRAGAAFAPLDPRDPPGRGAAILAGCGARALVVAEPAAAAGWTGDTVVVGDPAPDAHDTSSVPPADPDSLAYVIHTSGSTGMPKGVMITHRGLCNYLAWAVAEYGIEPGTVVPLHTSVAFDLAVTSLLGPLFAGACTHVLPESDGPLAVARQAGGYRMLKTTPSHLLAVLAGDGQGGLPPVVVLGGENVPGDLARGWRELAPATMFVNEYGPTETVVGSTAYHLPDGIGGATVPIGTPIANTVVHVLDQHLRPVPVGVRGELVIGGAGVARGYRNSPGLTAERFVPDPFGSGERLYRTGDLAFWRSDGTLELVGRMDDQIKVLGYRVEPGEIEGALAAAPGVGQAAVVVDRRAEEVRLVGFVAPAGQPGEEFLTRIGEHVRRRLPAHMVPDSVVLVDRMPTNANGKVDRAALPLPDLPRTDVAPPAGRGSGDRWHDLVRMAWSHVLEVDDPPSDMSFFEVGGTSLMLIKLLAALRVRGVTELAVTDLFRFPTIDDLADHLAGAVPASVTEPQDAVDRSAARREHRQRARSRRDNR